MPQEQATKTVRSSQISPLTLILLFLFFGLVLSSITNVTQDRKIAGLAKELAGIRQENQKQIEALHQAQTGSLEEDLLRLDQLTTQVQKANEEAREQATSLASRTRSELTKSVEERHQEMISTMSDLRADLRSQKNAASGQLNELEKPDRDTPRPSSETASSRPARLQDSSTDTTSLVS
jgi:hypothetical protein